MTPGSLLLPRLRDRRWLSHMALLNAGGWLTVALVLSLEGLIAAELRNSPQAWWPSFGYSLAIFSIWMVLTPLLAFTVDRIEAQITAWPMRLLLYIAGWPIVCLLHVGLFALLFWDVYADSARMPTRGAFAIAMFVRNMDLDGFLYAGIVLGMIVWRRRTVQRIPPARSPGEPLAIRVRGGVRLIPLDTIDWIGAAGDYAELHVGTSVELVDESLSALARRLPVDAFARIHRSTIIRRDRVAEIRSAGHGDAHIILSDGSILRLSRRFRSNLIDSRSRLTVGEVPVSERT